MPTSFVRLSAGREQMNEQMQALCFMAGANSLFYGCKLLTAANPNQDKDQQLFRKLNINPQATETALTHQQQIARLEEVMQQMDTAQFYNAAL